MQTWNQTKTSQLKEFVSRIADEYSVPGLSVALAKGGRLLFAEGFGKRDLEADLPATKETVYGIASVTKSFTALSCLLLAQEGKLSLGDPIGKHLPEWDVGDEQANAAMTIHHFLTHAAGLPPSGSRRYCVVRSLEGDPSTEELKAQGKYANSIDRAPIDTYEQLMEYWQSQRPELLGPCGAQFSYSNDGFALLGAIVQRVSGIPFADFVQQRILEPLGMTSSTFAPENLQYLPDVTQLYIKTSDGAIKAAPQWTHAPAMLGSGYIKSSVVDLVRYGQALLGYRQDLIRPQLLAKMTSPYIPCGPAVYYGYGLMIHPNHGGHKVIEHGGSQKAVSAAFGVVPGRSLTAAVLTNLADVPAQRIWLAAVNLALDLPLDKPFAREPQYDSRIKELQRWVGSYRSEEGIELEVTLEDEQAYLVSNGKKQAIRQSGSSRGAIEYRGSETGLAFTANGAGEINGVRYGYRIVPKVRTGSNSSH